MLFSADMNSTSQATKNYLPNIEIISMSLFFALDLMVWARKIDLELLLPTFLEEDDLFVLVKFQIEVGSN